MKEEKVIFLRVVRQNKQTENINMGSVIFLKHFINEMIHQLTDKIIGSLIRNENNF